MYQSIISLNNYEQVKNENAAVLIYFSHEQCNVCKVLKPQIAELVSSTFPEIKLYYVDTVLNPEIAAQLSIFAVPTMLVYFDGKEFIRKSRNVGISELEVLIERPYQLMF